MKRRIDQRERAKTAWDILTELALNKQHTTYGGLGSRMGVHYRTCRFFLGLIQDYCRERGIPPLQSLVVNKASGRPGSGYMATSIEDIRGVHQSEYSHDWANEQNPF